MVHDTGVFPAVMWEGGWVPEARSYKQDCLPHQVNNHEAVFPRAMTSPSLGCQDLDVDVGELESHGQGIGRRKSGNSIDEGWTSGRGPNGRNRREEPQYEDNVVESSGVRAERKTSRRRARPERPIISWAEVVEASCGERWADLADDEEPIAVQQRKDDERW